MIDAKVLNKREKSPYEMFTETQIKEAFEIFDEDRKGKAKIKHLGTIVKALGRVPKETNLQELAEKVEEADIPGYFTLEKLLPPLTEILMKDEWKSASKKDLIRAFRVLDMDRKGYVEENYLKSLYIENDGHLSDTGRNVENDFMENENKRICYKEYCADLVAPQVTDICESRRKIREKLADDRYRVC